MSARLYLRGNDHCEALYDGLYHNAMVLVKDDYNDLRKRKPLWRKYKPQSILMMPEVWIEDDYWYQFHLCSLDVANKVMHRYPVDMFITATNTWNFGSFLMPNANIVSKNGYDYSYITDIQENPQGVVPQYKFGRSYSCGIGEDSSNLNVYVYSYSEVDVGDSYEHNLNLVDTISHPKTTIPTFKMFGNGENCCFVAGYTESLTPTMGVYERYLQLYKVTRDEWTMVDHMTLTGTLANLDWGHFSNNYGVVCHNGLCVNLQYYRNTVAPFQQGIRAYVSEDDGDTWYYQDILPAEGITTPNLQYACPIYRNGTWYIYALYSSNNKQKYRLWKTEDFHTVEEVEVPDYFDIKLMETDKGHGCVTDIGYKKIRIITNTYDADLPDTPSDTVESVFLGLGAEQAFQGSYGIEVRNGVITQDSPTNWLCFYAVVMTSDSPIICYMDNNEFIESSGNMAFAIPTDLSHSFEEIQPDDYVCTPINE